ncbi:MULTISPECIES: benzoate/H(+) symporter BenE family transporter [unclassified Microbacterium]|uniref:benzoate/H(+) symporter BenE family transporter n=1 Tax=unclassified Microbacterium TaxID=2609290 RepID=UPI002469C3EC|nr:MULTISPECIES: benzoate/H(+) symporter BenE family transporter [unclassified Microbacterium]MDH5134181.1 benzoate/H(+) symporter BenE family transporter [Microbacterium sp. RD10]MDH5137627.1 benzoate/H(+) symporter BenE family transporter [Microbacterium sp. RD11]MDH5143817.1 benzoate/H(+) symporter BenE family transporter [Microbacterium sp. RD12]MDH5154692.1 benzoate/H(+) symporter BenE family transporter [Microbacterium sp. RD06]MDH5167634.1 benzoate/H(+) symporter BenE family transporter
MPAAVPVTRPIVAGIVTALVGFTSSFAVVLTGLDAVGASAAQAASGLLAVSLAMGLACIVLAWRYRMPITAAWSTPGAALLVATGSVEGGWPAAVGAFLVTASLILLTALWPALGALIARIPPSIAQAMLAGVLLPLCLAPITGVVANPWGVLPVVLTWLLFARLAPRWAVPLAFAAAAAVVALSLVSAGTPVDPAVLLPRFELTMPAFTVGALVGIALPLFIVTMASQNVPGIAIMRSFGYKVPWRPAMLVTGLGTALGAPAGGHAINLAAISAALAASPDADPDPTRRWLAGVSTGASYLVLGAFSAAFATLVVLAPTAVIPAVAGLALFGAFGAAVQQAIDDPGERLPAVVTFLVAASGIAVLGVSAAFWALVAGLLVRTVLHVGRPSRG